MERKFNKPFNLNDVIQKYKLDMDDVAEAIFPNIKYKNMALIRVLKGKDFLDTAQMERLADLAGVFVHELYSYDNWKGRTENGLLVLTKGRYTVRINDKTLLSVYDGAKLINPEKEIINTHIKLDELLDLIDEIINNYKNNL